MHDYAISAGLVHAILWFSLALTVISAALNIQRAIRYRDQTAALFFFPRGVLSACYTAIYALRLTQPVKEISDPTSMFAFSLGIAAWSLVWIMPAALYKPTPTPNDVTGQKDRP